jgi:hypothetical protein
VKSVRKYGCGEPNSRSPEGVLDKSGRFRPPSLLAKRRDSAGRRPAISLGVLDRAPAFGRSYPGVLVRGRFAAVWEVALCWPSIAAGNGGRSAERADRGMIFHFDSKKPLIGRRADGGSIGSQVARERERPTVGMYPRPRPQKAAVGP